VEYDERVSHLEIFVPLVFFRLVYCSEMYKCLHEIYVKTVPDMNQFT